MNKNKNAEKIFAETFLERYDYNNQGYIELHKSCARYIAGMLHPKRVLDIGAGIGATILGFDVIGVSAYGIEPNQYLYLHSQTHNKLHGKICNTKMNSKSARVFAKMTNADVVTCIEVMEHVTDAEILDTVSNIIQYTDWFVFSSTPKKTENDKDWGHINIKSEAQWIDFFTRAGLKFYCKLDQPTNWTLLFKIEKNKTMEEKMNGKPKKNENKAIGFAMDKNTEAYQKKSELPTKTTVTVRMKQSNTFHSIRYEIGKTYELDINSTVFKNIRDCFDIIG